MKLRAPISSDADWITRACQDPDIQRWTTVPVPYRRPDADAFIATWAGSLLARAVVDAATDDGLAMAAIHRVTDGDAEIGYWVAPWARRQGVATWATLAMVDIAAAMDDVVSASLDISIHNPASQAVATAAGFVPGQTPGSLTVPDRDSNGDGESAALRFVRTLRR